MNLEEATSILTSHGYEILPLINRLIPVFGPDHLLMNTEPHGIYYDSISGHDVLQLAEALRDNHRCYVCQDAAVSRCPVCNQWTCEDDRRDFGHVKPKPDDHICALCLQRRNVAVLIALALKEEYHE